MNMIVKKNDKDAQLKVLKDALERIEKLAENDRYEFSELADAQETLNKIEHIAETALFDVTF